MKQLWRWIKLEYQYSNFGWWDVCDAIAISLMWLIVAANVWQDEYSTALVYCLMIIAWKLSFAKR